MYKTSTPETSSSDMEPRQQAAMGRRKAGNNASATGRFNPSSKYQASLAPPKITSEPSESSSTGTGSDTSSSQGTIDTLSTTGSPVVAFSHVLNDLVLIPDDNLKHDVTLTPTRFSISSNTAVLRELSGKKIATFKCNSLATKAVMVTFGAVLLKALVDMWRGNRARLDSNTDGTGTTDQNTTDDRSIGSRVISAITDIIGPPNDTLPWSVRSFVLRTYRGLTGRLAVVSVGISVITNGWRSEMTMQGARGDSHMRAQFMRPRNGYVIKMRGPGATKVRTKWVLAMDMETKTWRLSTIAFSDADEARVLERRVELEFADDATPAATVEAEAFERDQQAEVEIRSSREAALERANAQSGMLMGQGTESDLMLTQLAMSGGPIMSDVSSDGFGGAFSQQRRKAAGAEGGEDEKNQKKEAVDGEFATTTTPLDEDNRPRFLREEDIPMSGPGAELAVVDEPADGGDIAVPTGEGPSLDMEFPMQMKQNEMYTDSKGGFTLDVTKRSTVSLALSKRIWVTPIFGSEMYTLRFDGETSAPRDVLAFATYIVRSSDSVQIAPLLLYAIFTGAVLVALAILYTFAEDDETSDTFLQNLRKIGLDQTGMLQDGKNLLSLASAKLGKSSDGA
jgi:hypothetical protein